MYPTPAPHQPRTKLSSSGLRNSFKPALLAAILTPAFHLMADTTWTGGNGDWSDSGNWDNGIPAISGDTVTFDASGNVTSTIDSSWATSGSVNGIVFAADSYDYILDQGDGVSSLSIGSGGISGTKTGGYVRLNGTINLTADQTWASGGAHYIYSNLTGSGNLTLTGSSRFYSGNSDAFTGNITIAAGTTVSLWNTQSQLNRLGTNATFTDTSTLYMPVNPNGGDLYMSTNLFFNDTSGGGYNITNSTGNAGNLILDGNWTGSVSGHLKSIRLASVGTPDSDHRLVIAGDNSGLTSTVSETTPNGYGGFSIQGGFVQLTSDNALGANNSIYTTIGIGQGSDATSGLFTTDGHDVTAKIGIKSSYNGSGGDAHLGLDGSGSATFSGNVELQSRTSGGVVNVLHLKAESGGVATFSGKIYDANESDTIKIADITVEGGGTVVLSGDNTYSATTTVAADTTLLANSATGSATGTGAVIVQNGATLGGTGRIAAGAANGITAESGATLAPGASIGSLVLDGADTTGPVLTMDAGSTFAFELGSDDGSDQIILWNYTDGDLVLNDNIINFTGAQEGTYTLFEFFSDDGSTIVGSGISDGLVIGTGLEGFDYTLNYNSDSITLDVIPEPNTFALWFGFGALLLLTRRHR